MNGILAVWNDRSAAIAAEYERWYMSEHIPERLAVPGFRTARRYQAIDADREFFTFYEVDSPAVLSSPDYVARLADPTPLTRSIMPHFSGMIRSVFGETVREGTGVGGAAVVVRYAAHAPDDLLRMIGASEIISARLWRAAPNAGVDTVESRTRPQPDETAAGAIVIETARASSAASLAMMLRLDPASTAASIGCYQLLCAMP